MRKDEDDDGNDDKDEDDDVDEVDEDDDEDEDDVYEDDEVYEVSVLDIREPYVRNRHARASQDIQYKESRLKKSPKQSGAGIRIL